MEFVLEFANTVIYFACVIIIGQNFLGYRKRQLKNEKIYLMIIAIMTTVVIAYPNGWLNIIWHLISGIVIIRICFNEKWKTVIGLYVGSTAVLSMLSMLFKIILDEISLFLNWQKADSLNKVFSSILIFLSIKMLGKYFEKKNTSGLKNVGTKYWVLFIITMFFDASVIMALGAFILEALEAERRFIAIFSYWCVVIGLLIQLVLLINTLVTRNVHKENEKLAKQFLENQNEHYQYLEKREHETKKFRHDIKNHLILLENFINTKKYDEAKDYLNTINEKVTSFSNQISVNNGIADAILNRFYTEAIEKGITLKVSGHFPIECYITAYDICTVLSNLLSNAIRAEIEAEGREVLVNIKYTDDKVLFIVENDYVHELNEVDGVFKTTKQDSLGHGYGLSNVNECVEKNGGSISISTEQNRFKVMIMMLNEKEEQL